MQGIRAERPSGGYNDIRDIQAQAAQGNARRNWRWTSSFIRRGTGSAATFLQLNGADALVFTAGIGENRPDCAQAICANLDQLGIVLDRAEERGDQSPGSGDQRRRIAR